MIVFIIFDTKYNTTYEYHITTNCTTSVVYNKILSRGKDIMPKIEKMFTSRI